MAQPINRRADEMWSYIRPVLSQLTGKEKQGYPMLAGWRAIDLGSGHGDFTVRMLAEGAATVVAVDNNSDNLKTVRAKVEGMRALERCVLVAADLDSKRTHVDLFQPGHRSPFSQPEIAICTSVLPYLKFPGDLLYMMADNCVLSIIECQYDGDGPGYFWIKDDVDMERWLRTQFSSVSVIGRTELDIRSASRTIWACTGKA